MTDTLLCNMKWLVPAFWAVVWFVGFPEFIYRADENGGGRWGAYGLVWGATALAAVVTGLGLASEALWEYLSAYCG